MLVGMVNMPVVTLTMLGRGDYVTALMTMLVMMLAMPVGMEPTTTLIKRGVAGDNDVAVTDVKDNTANNCVASLHRLRHTAMTGHFSAAWTLLCPFSALQYGFFFTTGPA
jgi:hypothetical protein